MTTYGRIESAGFVRGRDSTELRLTIRIKDSDLNPRTPPVDLRGEWVMLYQTVAPPQCADCDNADPFHTHALDSAPEVQVPDPVSPESSSTLTDETTSTPDEPGEESERDD